MSRNLYKATVWFEAESFDQAVRMLKNDAYSVTALDEVEKGKEED